MDIFETSWYIAGAPGTLFTSIILYCLMRAWYFTALSSTGINYKLAYCTIVTWVLWCYMMMVNLERYSLDLEYIWLIVNIPLFVCCGMGMGWCVVEGKDTMSHITKIEDLDAIFFID